jgi:hypothetical protein
LAHPEIRSSGTLFVTEVEVGGRLCTSEHFKTISSEARSGVEDKIRASLKASYDIPLVSSGKAGVSHEDQQQSGSQKIGQQSETTRNWLCVGGHYQTRTK